MTDVAPRRVRIVQGGPIMVEGPVCVELPDGSTAESDRFMVAICACHRSKTYPWCDTSHRRRARGAATDSTAAKPAEASAHGMQ